MGLEYSRSRQAFGWFKTRAVRATSSPRLIAFGVLTVSFCQGCIVVPMRAPTQNTGAGGEPLKGKVALDFIQTGKTSREEVGEKLGWMNAGIKDQRFFLGRWSSSSWGTAWVVAGTGSSGAGGWNRLWGTHNVLVEFDDKDVVKKYRVFSDSELVPELAARVAERPEPLLDLSKPVEISIRHRHGPKKYFDGTLVLGADSFVYRGAGKERKHDFEISPKQIGEIRLAGLQDHTDAHYLDQDIHFTTKTAVGTKMTARVDLPTLLLLVKYIAQTKTASASALSTSPGPNPVAQVEAEAQAEIPGTSQAEREKQGEQETATGDAAVNKNLSQHYRLLEASKLTTVEGELNGAGSAGYRVVNGGPFGGQGVGFFLEKSGPPETYEYRVWGDGGSVSLEGMGNKIAKSLEDKLNEKASVGFRLVPACTFSRERSAFSGLVYGGGENVICMEKSSAAGRIYQYRVVHDGGLKRLHEKTQALLDQDYTVVALDEATANFAILERPADAGSPPKRAATHPQRYLVLTTNRVSAIRKNLNEKAKSGYHLKAVCFATNAHRVALQQETNPAGQYEYETVSIGDKTFDQKIEQNGKRGFRIYPRTLGNDLIMEKAPGSASQYQYMFVSGKSVEDVFAKIDEKKQQGFQLLGLVDGGILLEKISPGPRIQ